MFNQQFLANPRVFANGHTLYPFADGAVNQGQMKTLALSDGSQFTQVQGENKVAWCNIQRARDIPGPIPPDISGNYREDDDLYVMRVTYQKSGTAFPVYYLPWATNSMFRIKLKPSPNHPTQTGIIFKDTVEPDVFITAALQGCSIIVSGDPQQPVVYHLNAQGINGPHGETLGSATDIEILAAANAKRLHMLGRYNLARTDQPKEGRSAFGMRPPQTFTSTASHLTDYMPDNLGSLQTALAVRYLQGAAGQVEQYGTVFGIRKADGNWRFYRQTRTRVCRFGPPIPNTLEYADTTTWENPVCVKFWP
jgi:hypothetical protein